MEARNRSRGTSALTTLYNVGSKKRKTLPVFIQSGVCPSPYAVPHWHYVDGQDASPTVGSVAGYVSDQESISDVVGNRGGFNSVVHTKHTPYDFNTSLAKGEMSDWDVHSASMYNKIISEDGGQLKGNWNPAYHWTSTPNYPAYTPAPVWSDLVSAVGVRLEGKMEASTNILVTLAQLGQTIRMFRNPFGLRNLRKLRIRTPLSGVKFAANAWLEYRYGWKQLERDVLNFSRVYREVQDYIKHLIATMNEWAPIHESETGTYTPSLSWPQTGYYGNLWRLTCTDAEIRWKAGFGVEILRGYAFRTATAMQLMMQRTGANDLLSAIWDYVPFSFCVDWFINVTNFLERSPIFWDRYNLRRMGHSVKTEYRCRVNVDSRVYVDGQEYTQSHEGQLQTVYSRYERTAGFPSGCDGVGLFGGLNFTNFATGAALIAQRL